MGLRVGKIYQSAGSFLAALAIVVSGTSVAWPVFFSEKVGAASNDAKSLKVSADTNSVELNNPTSVARITVSAVDGPNGTGSPIELGNPYADTPGFIKAEITSGKIQLNCDGDWSTTSQTFEFKYKDTATATFCYRGTEHGQQSMCG